MDIPFGLVHSIRVELRLGAYSNNSDGTELKYEKIVNWWKNYLAHYFTKLTISKIGLSLRLELELAHWDIKKHFLMSWSPNTSPLQDLNMYRIAAQAALQAWVGMGGQGIGVRRVAGLIQREITPFYGVSFIWDRLDRQYTPPPPHTHIHPFLHILIQLGNVV